jgi:exo-beta-1,3-glucanase (GH17 family)
VDIIASHVRNIKIFSYDGPDLAIIEAVRQKVSQGAQLKLVVGIPNDRLERLSKNEIPPDLETVIGKYREIISCISVGNEPLLAYHADKFAGFLVPACTNVYKWLQGKGWKIGVTIAQNSDFMDERSWPPSIGQIKPKYLDIIRGTCDVMRSSGAPFLINIYPYYAHASNSKDVPLDYCLFKNTKPQFKDPNNRLDYFNIFDAMLDALHAALGKIGSDDLEIVVGECGWPTAGGLDTTNENAQVFNQNLINHCTSGKGTPLRQNADIRCFLFEMYNEDEKKDPPIEPYWGWYNYDQGPDDWSQKYPLAWP